MKLLLLEDIKFEDIEAIKSKLEDFYLKHNDNYEKKTDELLLFKTLGTFVEDTLYLWLNDSIVGITNYSFKNIEVDTKSIKILYSEYLPDKSVFDKIYSRLFMKPKENYEIFYLPSTFSLNIKYYGKYFTAFYDFSTGEYNYDPYIFSMSDVQSYYSKFYNSHASWKKADKFYLVTENDKFINYFEVNVKTAEKFKEERRIKYSFIDAFIKKNYKVKYSIISDGDISKIYLSDGRIITVDFRSDKVIREEKALATHQLVEKAKKIASMENVKYYSFYKSTIYVDLENDERELLIIMNINGKLLGKYQKLKENGLKKIIDFTKFSEVKIKRTQVPILEEEYIPGYYDVIAYDHDFQLTYRIYDDGRHELISRQILIATAIEKSERYLKDERLVRFPIFKKESSKYNGDIDSWILVFSGRNVEYQLKVYAKDDKILVEPIEIFTSKERMQYLFKKILGFKVVSIYSRKHIFNGKEIWIIKYKDTNDNLKVMKLTSEDDLLKYYKKR
jgi:hypothetical protein